jgi:hypothetical protein
MTLLDDARSSTKSIVSATNISLTAQSGGLLLGHKETECILTAGKFTSMQATSSDIGDYWLFSFLQHSSSYPSSGDLPVE